LQREDLFSDLFAKRVEPTAPAGIAHLAIPVLRGAVIMTTLMGEEVCLMAGGQ
jgi:hypothetical protein